MTKNHIGSLIEKNSIVDEGNGLIRVKGGLTLTDDSVQHNGTKYDIKSLSLDQYDSTLFANHGDEWGNYTIETVIGKLVGVAKKGKRIVAEGIQYAVNASPLANFAYNMTREGYLNSFSIGTSGNMPTEDGTYIDHSIFEISQVGIPNNMNAKINEIAINSIEQAKQNGLDTSELEKALHINTEDKPAEDEPSEAKIQQIKEETNMSDIKEDVKPEEKPVKNTATPQLTEDKIAELFANAVKPLNDKIQTLEKNAFDKAVVEPEFKPDTSNGIKDTDSEFAAMDYMDRHVSQIDAFRSKDTGKLRKLNEFNLNALKNEKVNGKPLAKNSITIEDMGNFVISPELITEIQGCRNDYADFVDKFTWRETLSLQTAWLERSGDIDMQNVEFCDDGEDGNRKPISEYGATPRTSNMEELAAVTPICNAATRFLAADLLGDVAAGYRNDYDRKRAQLVIARLEQAVDANGNSINYDNFPATDAVVNYLRMWKEIATCTPNGTFILSVSSLANLMEQAFRAGTNGPLAQLFTTGAVNTIWGRPYIVVPDDLLPEVGTGTTRTFVVEGSNVTVNHGVFYVRPENFSGRISGGLMYDLSDDASYEVVDSTTQAVATRSAFQRNEIVLRGSFFRNGFVLDRNQVAGILSNAVS